jgi:DnaK suppressor protein
MDNDILNKIKNELLLQKTKLLRLSLNKEDDEVDTDGDEFDEIQGAVLISISNQLNIRNNNKLDLVVEALKKIDNKSYGFCEDCGNEIPEKRLLINPYCEVCVDCAEDRENQQLATKFASSRRR